MVDPQVDFICPVQKSRDSDQVGSQKKGQADPYCDPLAVVVDTKSAAGLSATLPMAFPNLLESKCAGPYTMYRISRVAPCLLEGSFRTESPLRIILLITSQQTGILWLESGYPPTCLWRLPDSTST